MRGIAPLRSSSVIRAAGSQGDSAACRGVRLAWLANQRRSNRVAFHVRSAGGALTSVRRNRCRRQLRELYRRDSQTLPQGYDLLLTVQCPSTPQPFTALESAWRELCDAWRRRAAHTRSL